MTIKIKSPVTAAEAFKIIRDVDKNTIFTVNHEGYATLFLGHDPSTDTYHGYESINTVEDFLFRGETYHDGRDMWGLTDWELGYILNAFDFKRVRG